MDMSKAIREGRDRLGMSQEALAERLGVSRQAVSKWEMGTSVPSPENRRALSEILGTDLQVERETAPPVPLRRWKRLTLAAGLLCLALLAALTLVVPAWAEQTADDLFVYDKAGLLSEDEWLELELKADEISWRYNCAVYIVTVEDYEDYGSDPYDAAANIYNGNDLGIGEGRDGVLLLQSTWGRDYGLYIRDGYANSMIGKYARTLLEDAFLDDLAVDDWVGAYDDYLSTCADFFEQAAQGHPVRKPLMKVLPMALGIGVVLALAVCLFLKAKMKSVRQGAEADAYVTAEGLNLTEQYDNYTHTTKTSRKISKDSDSDSSSHSGGGGSGSSGKY